MFADGPPNKSLLRRVAAAGFSSAAYFPALAHAAGEDAPVAIEKQINTAKDLIAILGGGLVVLILIAVAIMVFRKAFGSSRAEEPPSGAAAGASAAPDPLVQAATEERRGNFSAAASFYEAGGDLDRAAELHVRSGSALRAAGIFMKTKNYIEAAKIFRNKGDHLRAAQALELYGNKLAAAREYTAAGNHAHAARLLERERLYAEAAEAYEPLLGGDTITAAGADHFVTHATLLALAGEKERAVATYRRVLEVKPGHPRASSGLQKLLPGDPGTAAAEAAEVRPRAPTPVRATPREALPDRRAPETPAPAAVPLPSLEELAREIELDADIDQGDPLHRVFTLRSMIHAGRMEPRYVMRLWVQVMRTLAERHGAGVVFGGLTPDSIVVDMENNVRIDAPVNPGSGYLSPEVRAGLPPDSRADLYSMGVILYELVSGSLEHFGTRRAGERFSDVPPWLDELIERCTGKNLDKRFRTTGEVSAALLKLKNATQE